MGEDGREMFIIVLSPFEEYRGETCHEVEGVEKLYDAKTKGVHIVKQLTKNTCEWTKVQQADLQVRKCAEGIGLAAAISNPFFTLAAPARHACLADLGFT